VGKETDILKDADGIISRVKAFYGKSEDQEVAELFGYASMSGLSNWRGEKGKVRLDRVLRACRRANGEGQYPNLYWIMWGEDPPGEQFIIRESTNVMTDPQRIELQRLLQQALIIVQSEPSDIPVEIHNPERDRTAKSNVNVRTVASESIAEFTKRNDEKKKNLENKGSTRAR
jgi:hypothetical protein